MTTADNSCYYEVFEGHRWARYWLANGLALWATTAHGCRAHVEARDAPRVHGGIAFAWSADDGCSRMTGMRVDLDVARRAAIQNAELLASRAAQRVSAATPADPYAFPGLSAATEAAIAEATRVYAELLRASAMYHALSAHRRRLAVAFHTAPVPPVPNPAEVCGAAFDAAERHLAAEMRLHAELHTLVTRVNTLAGEAP